MNAKLALDAAKGLVFLASDTQQPTCLRTFQAPSAVKAQPSRRKVLNYFFSCSSLTLLSLPCSASVPLDPDFSRSQRARAAAQLGAQYLRTESGSTQSSASTSDRIQQALQILERARQETAEEQYAVALESYDMLLQSFSDFAFTEYGRIERALVLYQVGRIGDCLLQLRDAEVALRGYADVHAALASVLYAERPSQVLQAEQQWEIAMEFDKRYASPEWVAQQKHWPPKALQALQRFLQLS